MKLENVMVVDPRGVQLPFGFYSGSLPKSIECEWEGGIAPIKMTRNEQTYFAPCSVFAFQVVEEEAPKKGKVKSQKEIANTFG